MLHFVGGSGGGRPAVERAECPPPTASHDVEVNHGRIEVRVTEKLLDRAESGAAIEQVGREAVAKLVRRGAGRYPRRQHGLPDTPLHSPVDVGLLLPVAVVFVVECLPSYLPQPGMIHRVHAPDSLRHIPPPDPGGYLRRSRYLAGVNRIIG